MSFSGRLRLALILAALLPTLAISLVVVFGLSQQVKRIEHRDASAACIRFSELLDNTSERILTNLHYLAENPEFQTVDWQSTGGSEAATRYRLPLLSLDFVEYIDFEGRVAISAGRPGLVGREIEAGFMENRLETPRLVYENDLHGSHPAVALTIPTENGYLRGGYYLDGILYNSAAAITRASIDFVDMREISDSDPDPPGETGVPFRDNDRLSAVLRFDENDQFYVVAHFFPYEQGSLFADFFTAIAMITVFSLALVIPAGLYFSSRTRRKLGALTGGADRVASGDFSRPVEVSGEGEFSRLGESFNRMMRQLTEYRQQLIVSQKIAAWQSIGRKIAHEVKNPLTPISIAIDDLKFSYRDRPEEFEKILQESSATIKAEIARIRKLIEQFSDFARIPPAEMRSIPAGDFIKDIAVLYRDEIDSERLVIENKAGSAELYMDPEQIRQVIINLVKNGFEAGAEQCRLALDIGDDRFRIEISDNGQGFPEKLLTEGPSPYFTTRKDGSGLGLVICQRIVHDHGGTMIIENREDGGARVIITLPDKDVANTDH